MKWQGERESDNVEDRRGMGIPGGGKAVGGIGLLVVVLVGAFFGVDVSKILTLFGGGAGGSAQVAPGQAQSRSPEEEQLAKFVRVVLADTEDVWQAQFAQMGKTYTDPTLVMFTSAIESACGYAQSAMGPFYCPADHKVYIDLSFYQEMKDQLGAPGDFAQAYVIAHEIGHHVQNLLGISDRVQALRQRADEVQSNQLSVRLELQADFLAGLWAHHAQRMRQILEPGDIEEALNAASAIGDDRLQKQARGHVTPDSFTHGTSAQRVKWFRRGFETGDFSQGDTFSAKDL
jgi:predicted metalloprotease